MEETERADLLAISRDFFDLKQKYDRLRESHRKLLNINQNLEDKLLQSIDNFEGEKFSLVRTISSLNLHLEELQRINQRLVAENERFKLDISVAIQLLHCKPSSFSACKLENLPQEFQAKAKCHIQQDNLTRNHSEKKGKVIRVPISAFPSTTVIYSVPSGDDEDDRDTNAEVTVPAETMAKVLVERQRELYHQIPNGSQLPIKCLHSPHSGLTDGLHYVDHGTQTYPNFIGEREKTRNTCIYCQGSPTTTRLSEPEKNNFNLPVGDPKVFVYTESETNPLTSRCNTHGSRKHSANTHRRKVQNKNGNLNSSYGKGLETEI